MTDAEILRKILAVVTRLEEKVDLLLQEDVRRKGLLLAQSILDDIDEKITDPVDRGIAVLAAFDKLVGNPTGTSLRRARNS